MNQYVLIRRMRVHAANAISGPLTYGLPSITAFLGFGHALERHVKSVSDKVYHGNISVHGVGVITHRIQMLDHPEQFERSLRITANPLNEHGQRPAFVEEGRCHLTVTLVLEVSGIAREKEFCETASRIIQARMKLAGGDIHAAPQIEFVADDRQAIRKLMPGYALIDRRSLLQEAMKTQTSESDALDTLHSLITVHGFSDVLTSPAGDEVVVWHSRRMQPGWVVPIVVGYQALTPVDAVPGARDGSTPHRFAEAVTSLGEFVMASRLNSLSDSVWRYQFDGDLYLAGQAPLVSNTSITR